MPEYECAECGETFQIQQAYASHAGRTGHDVSGTRRPQSRLRRLLATLGPRDTDGDGTLDVRRLGFGAFLAGVIIGHMAAHSPGALGNSALGILITLAGGRALSRPKRSPIPREWFDSAHFDMLLFGAVFGVALVVIPWDTLFAQMSGSIVP